MIAETMIAASPLLRFGLVGTLALGVDVAVLSLLTRGLGLDLFASRLASYLAAASFAWWLHRRFTFPEARGPGASRQWLRFVVFNALGAGVNYGTFVVLVLALALFARLPELAVAVAALVAFLVNYGLSRRFVFQPRPPS